MTRTRIDVKTIVTFVTGFIAGGVFAMLCCSMAGGRERESKSWDKAWLDSTYPVTSPFDGDRGGSWHR